MKTQFDAAELQSIAQLLVQLTQLGVPTKAADEWLAVRMESLTAVPSAHDLMWPWVGQEGIDEHLAGTATDVRPVLSCRAQVGRSYCLSPSQRDVVRQWFNMTPAPTVEVIELATYADGKHIRRMRLKSCEHVDPRRRAVMTMCAIDKWGEFCHAVTVRERERSEAAELEKFTQRITNLLDKAKEHGVKHRLNSGGIANELHAHALAQGWELGTTKTAALIRDAMKVMLCEKGELELAKLVQSPKFWDTTEGEKPKSKSGKPSAKAVNLAQLMNEYGVD
jgi:hypothetical protein